MTSTPPAVVVGLGSIVGLQTARVLARRGVPVIGVTGNRSHFAARTRVCHRVVEADVVGGGLVDALDALGSSLDGRAVLVPCTDHAVSEISAQRDRLSAWYDFVLPPHDVVRTLGEKASFAEHAARRGLPAPRTVVLRSGSDAVRAAATLAFPVVLKPTVKTALWKQRVGLKALRVDTPDELVTAHGYFEPWSPALVAQEYVAGPDDQLYTANVYYGRDGSPLVTFVTRKHRQWPPHLGIASFARECREDEVLALTLHLFSDVGFRGLGYLEVKRDLRRGYVMIEANVGRPTGRSATAEAGGVELLYTAYCDAAGLPLPATRQQAYGDAAWLDLRRDLLAAVHYWRIGELTVWEWLGSLWGRKAHAVFSLRDPMPFLLEIGQSTGKVLRRLRQVPVADDREEFRLLAGYLVGPAEIADLLNVKVNTVNVWKARHHDFPAPVKHLKTVDVWDIREIQTWAERTGRYPPPEATPPPQAAKSGKVAQA